MAMALIIQIKQQVVTGPAAVRMQQLAGIHAVHSAHPQTSHDGDACQLYQKHACVRTAKSFVAGHTLGIVRKDVLLARGCCH